MPARDFRQLPAPRADLARRAAAAHWSATPEGVRTKLREVEGAESPDEALLALAVEVCRGGRRG
jgi:hypothetical protein